MIELTELKKVSDKYYSASVNNEYKLEPEAVDFELQGFLGFDFFYKTRSRYQYAAYDGYTGRRLTGYLNSLISVGVELFRLVCSDEGIDYDQLKTMGIGKREKLAEMYRLRIIKGIEDHGLSPRWESEETEEDWL